MDKLNNMSRSVEEDMGQKGVTVRDLVEGEYRRHRLRSKILEHEEMDWPILAAIRSKDHFLHVLSRRPGVGEKALGVISKLLDRAASDYTKNR